MNLTNANLKQGILLIILTLVTPLTLALPSDRNQDIHIQSDRLERDENTGVTIYQGAVQMDQGTLRIKADTITVHSVDNRLNRIVAKGKPAHLQQKPAVDKNIVVAKGNTIEYFVANEKIYLINQASIEQEGSTMRGERIDYNIKDSIVTAEGNDGKSGNGQNKQIHIVIPAANASNDNTQP